MREIPVRRGGNALVDDADYDALARFCWQLHPGGYAFRSVSEGGRTRSLYMHREIMAAVSGVEVDHINRVKLDNRRDNLRLCDRNQNMANTVTSRMSGYRGVYWCKTKKRWCAGISVKNKRRNLGRFADPVEAAKAYDRAAVEVFGPFAILNFAGSPE